MGIEMIFIFLLALILFGPKRLPEMAREIGKFVAEFKRASNDFKYQLQSEIEKAGSETPRPSSLPHSRRRAANHFLYPDHSASRRQVGDLRHRRGPRAAAENRPHGLRRTELHPASARAAAGSLRRAGTAAEPARRRKPAGPPRIPGFIPG